MSFISWWRKCCVRYYAEIKVLVGLRSLEHNVRVEPWQVVVLMGIGELRCF